MIKFITESGSTYEINSDTKEIRRVSNSNNNDPTLRQTNDWRTYDSITTIKVGSQVVIFWDRKTTPLLEGSPDNASPATMTSLVVDIFND